MHDRRGAATGGNRAAQARLPVQLTTFIGRQAARDELERLLAGARLLTLTGPGGVGKTRLALAVAADLGTEFPAGVRLAELAALDDGALVPQAIATALGVVEEPDRPLPESLAAALGTGRCLLLLDNCEHLVAACAEIADRLLRECPTLSVLVTSREPLGIPGETIWPVPPLPVPDRRVALGTAEIAASAAVSLFVDRARLVQPAFSLDHRNAGVVAEICRRLDGIPLAIELAAARLRSLGVVEIAERLDDRFRLLTTELRTIGPRQQTLRATVDWSYDLLDEPERRMLRALTVFAGGFTLDAVEAVCAAPPLSPIPCPLSPPPAPLVVLARLVDRSLVLADNQGGRVRYRLLETIRQYGLEKLRATDEESILRQRHGDYFLGLAELAGPALRGPDQAVWIERLDLEHDNLRAALAWAVKGGDAERALRIGRALWRFLSYRGYLVEGRRTLDQVLAIADESPPSEALAEVLFAAGRFAHQQGEYDSAQPLFEASLAIAEQVGYAEGIVGALTQLGHLALNADDLAVARARYSQAIVSRPAAGDSGEVVVALASLALVSRLEGAYDDAQSLFVEALTIVERVGDQSLRAYVLSRLGELALDRGSHPEAEAQLRASLQIYQAIGIRTRLAIVLEGFAMLAAAEGQPTRALRLAGAAAALRTAVRARPAPHEAAWLSAGLERVRRQLGERQSAWVWTDGLALSLEQAIGEALDELDAPRDERDDPASPARPASLDGRGVPADERGSPLDERDVPIRPGRSVAHAAAAASVVPLAPLTEVIPFPEPPNGAPIEPLTERQREVAALVARGLTNRQIGEALVITEGTANLHVKHILRKLGFATRAQIAAWAVRQPFDGPLALTSERRYRSSENVLR